MRKAGLIFALFWGSVAAVFAQSGDAGNTALAFLKIGVGGRGTALASSYAASAMGAEASYWNPAALASARTEVYFSHAEWLLDIRNDFVAAKMDGFGGAVGVFLQMQSVGGIMQRSKASPEPSAEINAHDVAFGLSYARKIRPGLDVGGTLKYVGERIANYAANGFAVDFGARYAVIAGENVFLAASLHNIGAMSELRTEKLKLPAYVRAGLAFDTASLGLTDRLSLFAGVISVFDGTTSFSTAAEFTLRQAASLRIGYQFGRESENVAAGVGIQVRKYRIDYAYVPFENNLGDTHRVSLSIGF